MGLISFIKSLVMPDDDFDANESVTQYPVKNINNQVDLSKDITDDIDKSATEEVTEVTGHNATIEKETKDDKPGSTAHLSDAYNLIILDESGSMSTVREETISGCNETLISICNLQKEQPDIWQFVSVFCFNSSHSRYIFHDTPIDEVKDMTREDYCPSACTPLYDAIGYTVVQLFRKIYHQEAKGNVTIITDGYENASRKWTLPLVQELIATLEKKGWVFSFIGANIDVECTANSLGIDSFMKFEQTQTGMEDMFECERRSRRAYSEKRRYMQLSRSFNNMSEEAQDRVTGAMNVNYFVEDERIAPDNIVSLDKNEIFVFGSNVEGAHNGGAAYYALQHFGAKFGQAEGIQGQSYAIPTDGNSFEELAKAVERFTEYVVFHPQYKFMLTAVGIGNAGYEVRQIAPLFRQAYTFGNVYVPRSFMLYVSNPKVRY